MRKKGILITGAAGEIGLELLRQFADEREHIITVDLQPLPESAGRAATHLQGSILDEGLLGRLESEYEIDTIYHLAALLSKRGEFTPEIAHRVNVEGTLGLLRLASRQSRWRREPVKFIFPSSIAVFGLPDLATKRASGQLEEWTWNRPRTMYGCNKLYCEQLGRYYSRYYQQLAADPPVMVDYRSVRFPGLISAFTVPSGGTSDYGPEMIHAAAQGQPYVCFVREDTVIPFMAMPDAVKALRDVAAAPREALDQLIYNVTSFSVSAGDIALRVKEAFPGAKITFEPDAKRQAIIDSWPAVLDDSAARREWGWAPEYDIDRTFADYLIPHIAKRYAATG